VLFDPWIRDLASGIGFFQIPDPRSEDHTYFLQLFLQILKQTSIILLKFTLIFSFSTFSILLLLLDPGSGIKNPGSGMGKNQDPG
jgi:hypothetical protein